MINRIGVGSREAQVSDARPRRRFPTNCIAPSLTRTSLAEKLLATLEREKASADRHPMKRVGEADDIAAMAAFLLSSDAGWITGQVSVLMGA